MNYLRLVGAFASGFARLKYRLLSSFGKERGGQGSLTIWFGNHARDQRLVPVRKKPVVA
jgi:hypothetical protein